MPEPKRASPAAAVPADMNPESIKTDFMRHLKHTLARDRYTATPHDEYLALALATRDRLIERWIETQQTHHRRLVKRVYYLSLEYLTGRSLGNNVINLGMEGAVRKAMGDLALDWFELRDEEVDAGLGNGGLGRLAACFLESLATMQIPAMGYGLRYDYGIFRQVIANGYQQERPDDWLRGGNPWEIPRPDYLIPVRFEGRVEEGRQNGRQVAHWLDTRVVLGMPYDIPVVGYGGHTVNTLRLWHARSSVDFGLEDFQQGDYIAAVEAKVAAENLTRVLYPNDMVYAGRDLRLRQEYFFVACSLHDILRRFKVDGTAWNELPNRAAIQLNDTHPALAVPELMRLLVDEEGLLWEDAWDLTVRSLGYTNHTLMSEALERWPVEMIGRLLPRHLQIIYEINRRFLNVVSAHYPGDTDRLCRMSLIEEGGQPQVRMANLAILGSHSTNGVSAIHTDLVKTHLVPDFYAMYPQRFNSKTNGVTQRRWLLKANPPLAALITEAVGDGWITGLAGLERLAPLAEDPAFRERFMAVKRQAKVALAEYLRRKQGWRPDPDSLFDIHVKRFHEYKRQLLNVLGIVIRYNRLRRDPGLDVVPRTYLFGGKAAPAYMLAKLIIKLINSVAAVVNNDSAMADRLKVYFVPDYRVSLAERLIPAADVSEQISTAGTEASGTGNMKFMLNGALTVGTLDGANVEMHEEVGDDNIFIFGLKADEAAALAPHYNPREYYERDEEIREAVDMVLGGFFNFEEPGIFDPIREALFDRGDRYMHLADLRPYVDTHDRVDDLYRRPHDWARKAILNVARSGKFSSDRTIGEYLRDIWHVDPCPIAPTAGTGDGTTTDAPQGAAAKR
ncbi:MAG TPA: glycogen/starch/alpha-glucan phosphorylase [Phycisphaerae bacterium]|nr:glycogen/starch/alpha-glucan phosphorylase [Phycisphaerae bacterium]